MTVLATRASSREGPQFVEYVGLANELPNLIGRADIVVIAAPLTPDTKGLFNSAMFSKMKRGAMLVNFTRAEIVVPEDLGRGPAGWARRQRGHGLGVESPLPPDSPLWKAPNLMLTGSRETPRNNRTAGGTPANPTVQRDDELRWVLVRENMRRYATGEKMYSVFDPQARRPECVRPRSLGSSGCRDDKSASASRPNRADARTMVSCRTRSNYNAACQTRADHGVGSRAVAAGWDAHRAICLTALYGALRTIFALRQAQDAPEARRRSQKRSVSSAAGLRDSRQLRHPAVSSPLIQFPALVVGLLLGGRHRLHGLDLENGIRVHRHGCCRSAVSITRDREVVASLGQHEDRHALVVRRAPVDAEPDFGAGDRRCVSSPTTPDRDPVLRSRVHLEAEGGDASLCARASPSRLARGSSRTPNPRRPALSVRSRSSARRSYPATACRPACPRRPWFRTDLALRLHARSSHSPLSTSRRPSP